MANLASAVITFEERLKLVLWGKGERGSRESKEGKDCLESKGCNEVMDSYRFGNVVYRVLESLAF